MYTAFVVKLWVSKEVKPVKFCPLSLFCVVRLFRFYYFRRFRHSERGIKSLRLEVTFIKILHSFLFCWRIWPFLLLPGRTCRTWTILWTERLLHVLKQVWPQYGHTRADRSGQCGRHHKLWIKASEDLESLKRNSQVSRPEFTAIHYLLCYICYNLGYQWHLCPALRSATKVVSLACESQLLSILMAS